MIFLIVFVLWIIFNSRVTAEVCIIGLCLSAGVYWFCRQYLGYGRKQRRPSIRRAFLFVEYFGILVVEIIKANIQVLGIALSRDMEFEPKIVCFRTDIKETPLRVLLANSITLTPGTITVSLEDDLYYVHCLDESMAEDIDNSVFVRMLHRIEEV